MKILITGGTGYFGRAMTRYLLTLPATSKVCIYSRGEAAQAAMREEFDDDARLRFLIGDVRDQARLERAMGGSTDIVIHAAALKRVEVGEYNPTEMVKTNVLGTMDVINAAQNTGAGRMVLLSSDKACAPINCYGATKLTAEKLALAAGAEHPLGPTIVVTRYGNVAGSTGSVIPTWRRMIAENRAPWVTDQDMTRFWMSVQEAVDLVWFAATGHHIEGSLIVPSLPAFRVADLYQAMTGEPPAVVGSGVRPGEKLHEEMISQAEAFGFSRIDGYWIKGAAFPGEFRRHAFSSDRANRLSVEELRERLRGVA